MKTLRSDLLALILIPTISFAGNVDMRGNGEDCALTRALTAGLSGIPEVLCRTAISRYKAGRQTQANVVTICRSTQNVALQGEESGRTVSNDPTTEEAKMAEAVGYGGACGRSVGSLSLIEHNGKHYLVGAAHGFYKENGAASCDASEGTFFPDDHYTNTPGVDARKGYTFNLPPINAQTSLKTKIGYLDSMNMDDFVLLEIKDNSVLTNQFGDERASLKLARTPSSQLVNYARNNSVTLISGRSNYYNYSQISIEQGCSIRTSNSDIPMMRHNCDTGGGSSGTPLIAEEDGQLYSLGVHYAGGRSSDQEFERNTTSGNFFIPSNHILDVLEELEGTDYYNPEFLLSSMDLTDIEARKSTACAETPALCPMYTYAVSNFLKSNSAEYYRAAHILRQSAEAGFGPALMDLAALQEFETAAEIQPLSAQWPRGATYYEHLFNLKPQFPTDINQAAATYILALQNGDRSLLARTKDGWPETLARAMQTRLAELGMYSGPIDGDFGRGSMAAIAGLCQCQ